MNSTYYSLKNAILYFLLNSKATFPYYGNIYFITYLYYILNLYISVFVYILIRYNFLNTIELIVIDVWGKSCKQWRKFSGPVTQFRDKPTPIIPLSQWCWLTNSAHWLHAILHALTRPELPKVFKGTSLHKKPKHKAKWIVYPRLPEKDCTFKLGHAIWIMRFLLFAV